jgi:hypothetical protein
MRTADQLNYLFVQLVGGLEAFGRIQVAGLKNKVMKSLQAGVMGLAGWGREFGKITYLLARGHFVEDLAEAVNVRARLAWSFGRHVAFRAHKGGGLPDVRYQTDVRQLRHSMKKDDAGRLDIAVHETVFVQMMQCGSEAKADLKTGFQRQLLMFGEIAVQGPWKIVLRQDLLSGYYIIGEFHDVVEVPFGIVAANLQNADQSRMGAGDRLELFHPAELPLKGTLFAESLSMDDFDRAVSAYHAARQPHFSVAATADAPQQLMFGNQGQLFRVSLVWPSSTAFLWRPIQHEGMVTPHLSLASRDHGEV